MTTQRKSKFEEKFAQKWIGFAPEGGWKERTYYVVIVQFSPNNSPHRAIFYCGFLNGPHQTPGGYSAILHPTYEDEVGMADIFSLKVVSEIEGIGGKQP